MLQIKQEIFDLPKKLNAPVAQSVLDRKVEIAKKPLEHELDRLQLERQFILDRRNSWLPKTIWNLLVPIIVAFLTAYLTIFIDAA